MPIRVRRHARFRPVSVRDYVGVWADTADNCGRIDREYVERFAVITPTTIRHTESVCNFEAVPMEGDEATLAAECVAEGDFEERQITLTMIDFETLRISYDATEAQSSCAAICRNRRRAKHICRRRCLPGEG
jgi:hypothetical protein